MIYNFMLILILLIAGIRLLYENEKYAFYTSKNTTSMH